ncbi:MAG TPA: FAD-binding oxidoreductase [Gemmatimonadaceae bacterium]|nr:FAD-binding oxidoreductase [Gemmatimonadaceae bacterium]
MSDAADVTLAGWGGWPRELCREYRPHDIAEIAATLNVRSSANFIAAGMHRSYGDAALNAGGGVIRQRARARVISFDETTGELHAEAGMTIAQILSSFLPRGYMPGVMPGTKCVTLGGAIAANVHGKNHHRDGAFSSIVSGFDLLTAAGTTLRCSRFENTELFWATVGGMGLTGIVVSASIRLSRVDSAYVAVRTERTRDLDDTLERFSADDARFRHSVAWLDCLAPRGRTGRAVMTRGDHATSAHLPERLRARPYAVPNQAAHALPMAVPRVLLRRPAFGLVNAMYYALRRSSVDRVVDIERFFFPLDGVRNWNTALGAAGFIQYQLVLPLSASRQGLIELLDAIATSGQTPTLCVLKQLGPADAGLLSFPLAGMTLAVDLLNTGDALRRLVERIDSIVVKHRGRCYFAKDAMSSAEAAHAMYPGLGAFRALKRTVDPERVFSSSLARRLQLLDD